MFYSKPINTQSDNVQTTRLPIFNFLSLIISILILSLLVACKDDNSENQTSGSGPRPLAFANNPKADYELLFIGNSHSSVNNLPKLVSQLIEAGTEQSANAFNAPGWRFLDERQGDTVTQQSIEARDWTHVFLQAQKYSTTGLYTYPTTAAEDWIRRVKQHNATPVMFPEWPRRGNFEEGQRVYLLHVSIAEKEPACVAPVGPAWDLARTNYPSIILHAPDGNHSDIKGALLTAYVFYQVITGNKADQLDYVSQINVSESVQKSLREIASQALLAYPPCSLLDV
jgi:hypothetical protein